MTVTKEMIEAQQWRRSINYGPDGQEDWANLITPEGDHVANIRTHHADRIVREINRTLSSRSAEEGKPVVKGLEWAPHPIFGGYDLAVALIKEWGEHGHKYQVGRDADALGYKAFLAPTHGSWFWASPGHGSLDAAKAAAQADYEARIRSALSTPAETNPSKVDARDRKFKHGDRVTKTKGSSWTGHVVGFYSTALTPVGYCVESETETGSVQIYPESALAALGEKQP